MMQILLCVVITTLFKMAMHVPKKKDEADQVEQEASKEPEMSELEKQLEFQRKLKKQTSLDALLRKQQDNLTKKPAGAKKPAAKPAKNANDKFPKPRARRVLA